MCSAAEPKNTNGFKREREELEEDEPGGGCEIGHPAAAGTARSCFAP